MAQCLACLGIHAPDLGLRVQAINLKACRPPQPRREVWQACKVKPWLRRAGDHARQTRSDVIARELEVTAAEAKALNLESIMPTAERQRRKEERRRGVAIRATVKTDVRKAKQKRLVELYHKCNKRLPGREVVAAELGVSYDTVTRWCRELGIRVRRPGRPRFT